MTPVLHYRASADLALFTGVPTFRERRAVGRPNIVDPAKVLDRIAGALDQVWLTNDGPLVRELEERLADYLDVPHCIATSNATAALELVMRSLDLSGEVIVPSWTFIADPHAVLWTGLDPVFCDVDRVTQCIDPERVEAAITPDTSAILAVHLWGRGCDVRALADIADRHGLELIYDAAHALGCRIEGRRVGGFGRAEVFSLHATKMVNSFEGGVITTSDDDHAATLRRARNFGFCDEDEVSMAGTNAKMSEPSAAMGLTSFEAIDELIAHNHANYDAYRAAVAAIPGVDLPAIDASDDSNRHYVVLDIDAEAAGLTRNEIVDVLRADNVWARRYFYPGCHRQEPYRTTHPDAGSTLPVTEALAERVMVLPTGSAVVPEDASRIGSLIATAVDQAPAVRRTLAGRHEGRLASGY